MEKSCIECGAPLAEGETSCSICRGTEKLNMVKKSYRIVYISPAVPAGIYALVNGIIALLVGIFSLPGALSEAGNAVRFNELIVFDKTGMSVWAVVVIPVVAMGFSYLLARGVLFLVNILLQRSNGIEVVMEG